jgi:hypothetical protein
MDWLTNIFKGIGGLFGGGQQQKQSNEQPWYASRALQNPTNQSRYSNTGFPTMPQANQLTNQTQQQNMFKPNIGQALLGGGVSLGGQMFGQPKMPDVSNLGSVQAMRNFDVTKNTQQISPEMKAAFDRETQRRDQEEQKHLYRRYANLQPGNAPEESTNFKTDLGNLQRTQGDRASDELAKMYAQNSQTQLGINQAQGQQYQDIAQLEVDQIMNQYGLDYISAMKMKELFGNMGGTMLSSAFGDFNPLQSLLGLGR